MRDRSKRGEFTPTRLMHLVAFIFLSYFFQSFLCLFAGFCVSSEIVLEMAIILPMVDYLQD